jgi:hypothetical protein
MPSAAHRAWSASVWFTAVMTLTAGFPHLQCRCPDGHIKPVCFGPSAPGPGCCDRACCPSARRGVPTHPPASEKSPAPCCCCHRHAPSPPDRSEPLSGLEPRGCTRVLTPAPEFTPGSAPHVDQPELAAVLPPADAGGPALPSSPDARPAWCVHTVSPPTDRVILFQHFLL